MSKVLEISKPANEPIAIGDVQSYLKLPSSSPDLASLVPKMQRAARRMVENWTGLTLAQRKFVQYQDGFPFFPYFQSPYAPLFGAAFPFYFGYGPIASYPFPAIGGLQNQMLSPFEVKALRNPVTEITGINYIGIDGKKHSLIPFRDFVPDFPNGRVLPLPGQRWPVSIVGANTVEIFFSAGYAPDGTTALATFESSPGWEPGQVFAQYSYLIDPNGNVQLQTTGATGTTGATAPTWATTPGATTVDNTASWQCLGPILGEWDPETEYAQYAVVFDSNGNLETLIVSTLESASVEPTWSTTLGATTTDGVTAAAWRCLGKYQGVLPNPPDQPSSYESTIACPATVAAGKDASGGA